MIAAGRRTCYIGLTTQGPPRASSPSNGGYGYSPTPLTPSHVYAEIKTATERDLERLAAGTSIATATHVVTMPFHPGVNIKTLIDFQGRTFRVTGVATRDEGRQRETVAVCAEVVS